MGDPVFNFNGGDGSTQSARTMDDASKIIQCPACQTKFAVAAAVLRESPSARFHCSRCDHMFGRDEGVYQYPYDNVRPAALSRPARANTSSNYKGLQIPRSLDGSLPVGAPHESEEAADSAYDTDQMELSFPPSPRRRTISTADVEERLSRLPRFSVSNQDPAVDSLGGSAALRGSAAAGTATLGSSDRPGSSTDSHAPYNFPQDLPLYRKLNPWKDAAFLATPIVLMLGCLLVLALFMRNQPGGAEVASKLFASLPHGAPAGLTIDQLKFERLNLENGETVQVISGRLLNRSERSFSKIVLEGLAFDQNSKVIARVKAPAGSSLAQTRIKSLSLAMIENLQEQEVIGRFGLKPKENLSFVLAFPGHSLPELAYFSARVYSVQP